MACGPRAGVERDRSHVEQDTVECPSDVVSRHVAEGAQQDRGGALLEVVEDLGVRGGGVDQVVALADVPHRAMPGRVRTAGVWGEAGEADLVRSPFERPVIERLHVDSGGGSAGDQTLLERGALQDVVDEPQPVLRRGRSKVGRNIRSTHGLIVDVRAQTPQRRTAITQRRRRVEAGCCESDPMSPDHATATWLLTFVGNDVTATDIGTDALWSSGALAIEERETGPGEPTLIAGFGTQEAADRAVAHLGSLRIDATTSLEPAPQPDQWHDVWLDHLEVAEIGPFVVHPPWLNPPAGGKQHLSIDPGRAFGSGQHPSTALAIQLLDAAMSSGDRVLDVGTGTGILAIAAANLGATDVLGIDIDPAAVSCASANVRANADGDRIRITDDALDDVAGTFDVVAANITCHSMLPLLASLVTRTDRRLILSGLLADQRDLVITAIANHTLSDDERRPARPRRPDPVLHDERVLGDWLALDFNYGA